MLIIPKRSATDLAAVDALIAARRLDLIIVWRAEERKWAIFPLRDQWTPLLCGSLERLNEEQRAWWRQWLIPQFQPENEVVIHSAVWQENLASLQDAYPTYWEQYTTSEYINREGQESQYETRPQNWNDNLDDLKWILENATSEILAMPNEQYEKLARNAVGGYVQIMHQQKDPFVELSPLYSESKDKKRKKP